MIVYLHGFNSTGLSRTAGILAKRLDVDVYSPTYPSNDPDKAIEIISNLIEKHKDGYDQLMVVGSSMGGFFAQYIGRKYDAKIVLINPALKVLDSLLKYLGENKNFGTGEKYTLTEATHLRHRTN